MANPDAVVRTGAAAVRADKENATMRKTIVLLALAAIVLLMLIQFSPSFLAS
jgi:hypothetical protein